MSILNDDRRYSDDPEVVQEWEQEARWEYRREDRDDFEEIPEEE